MRRRLEVDARGVIVQLMLVKSFSTRCLSGVPQGPVLEMSLAAGFICRC